jgi:hypothetical protein
VTIHGSLRVAVELALAEGEHLILTQAGGVLAARVLRVCCMQCNTGLRSGSCFQAATLRRSERITGWARALGGTSFGTIVCERRNGG